VALTGFGRAEDAERADAEGFDAHLTKPIDLDTLIETILNILGVARARGVEHASRSGHFSCNRTSFRLTNEAAVSYRSMLVIIRSA